MYGKVAVDRTSPNGRVVGIDIIPAQPPKGVSTIQGNFLSPSVQEEVKRFLREPDQGWLSRRRPVVVGAGKEQVMKEDLVGGSTENGRNGKKQGTDVDSEEVTGRKSKGGQDEIEGRVVDVVLSDMSEPWAQTDGFWKRSLSDPYHRMMNTSGMPFRDHAGSMVCECPCGAAELEANHRDATGSV